MWRGSTYLLYSSLLLSDNFPPTSLTNQFHWAAYNQIITALSVLAQSLAVLSVNMLSPLTEGRSTCLPLFYYHSCPNWWFRYSWNNPSHILSVFTSTHLTSNPYQSPIAMNRPKMLSFTINAFFYHLNFKQQSGYHFKSSFLLIPHYSSFCSFTGTFKPLSPRY